MRRISKREIAFRVDMLDRVRVDIERLERGHAVVKLEGIECRLEIARSERRDLATSGKQIASVVSYPNRLGDGMPPRGLRQDRDAPDGLFRGLQELRVCLTTPGCDHDVSTRRYQRFEKKYPVGSLIEAEVISVFRDKIRMRLAHQVYATMPINSYVDRLPNWRRMDLSRFPVPERLEVIVRSVNPEGRRVEVTLHGYQRDQKYCNATAGYRQTYDAHEGMFRLLPWRRGTNDGT